MLTSLTQSCRTGHSLDSEQCAEAVAALLDPALPDPDKEAFLIALTEKGETATELASFVEHLLPHSLDPGIRGRFGERPLFDCCGTGGGKLDLINVSTALMFLLPCGHVPVVKHGNRGVTKKSGSADVLEALGGTLPDDPGKIRGLLEQYGFAFCFAPSFHPAFKVIGPVRKKLAADGRRTIFNLLGPLLNPCRPEHQMIGVFQEEFLTLFSECCRLLGRKRFLILYGEDSTGRAIGEASTLGRTRAVGYLDDAPVDQTWNLASDQALSSFLVANAAESAERLEQVFTGDAPTALTDLICLNAGFGAWINNLADSPESGAALCHQWLQNGQAAKALKTWRG